MENKQTAVEWLISVLAHNDMLDHKALSSNERLYNLYKRLVEQAKEMEKQQKINFATDFARDYIGFSSVCTDVNDLGPAAYYYNQINK